MAFTTQTWWFRPGRLEKTGRQNPGILSVEDKYEFVAHESSKDKQSWTYVCKYRKTPKVACPVRARVGLFNLSLTFSVLSNIFKFKGQRNLNSENFGNLLESLVTLISKWPGISKIYPPILDYRMLCVLSNDLLVFDSSQETPCIKQKM